MAPYSGRVTAVHYRRRAHHRLREGDGALEGNATARLDDRGRDPARATLAALVEEEVGQVLLVPLVDDVGRRAPPVGVHAHVERTVRLEAEPAARLVEVQRARAEVVEHADDRLDLRLAHQRVQVRQPSALEDRAVPNRLRKN